MWGCTLTFIKLLAFEFLGLIFCNEEFFNAFNNECRIIQHFIVYILEMNIDMIKGCLHPDRLCDTKKIPSVT